MTKVRFVRLFAHAAIATLAGAALIACGTEPKIEVQVATATPAAIAPLATPVEGSPGAMSLPASHPPLDGAPRQAPPLASGAAMPPDHPPMGAAPMGMALPPVDPSLGSGDKAIAWEVPAGWVSVPPSSSMRRAQYKVPGKGGDAECAVFYFGPGQGGDPQANAERWASQFLGADGQPGSAKMTTRQIESNGVKILFVETRGSYMAGAMAGGSSEAVPGQALLGAIAEGPDANWFFKMTGPEATVEGQRVAFEKMLASLRRGS